MSKLDIKDLIIDAVKEIGEEQDNDALNSPTGDTRLFGENLDSMGIVFLVTELEERISDDFGVDIALADERAMSQKTSPFRTINLLAKYIQMLIDEAKAAD